MSYLNRRAFLGTSGAAVLAAYAKPLLAQAAPPSPAFTGGTLTIKTAVYSFTWQQKTDTVSVMDSSGRRIAYGPLQPVIVTSPLPGAAAVVTAGGLAGAPVVTGNRAVFTYTNVNMDATVTIALRFDDAGFWMEPFTYDSPSVAEIVSVHYFAGAKEHAPAAALRATFATVPAIAENAAISPIQAQGINLDTNIGLGHSGVYGPAHPHQQWGMPVHYFCVNSTTTGDIDGGRHDTFTRFRTQTMCCGLADLPNGDLEFDLRYAGHFSPWIDYRSDLWHHLRSPGKLKLGSTFAFAFGEDQYSAITAYYMLLLNAGVIQRKQNSTAKNAVVCAPEFCTWGVQVERHVEKDRLSQTFCEDLFAEMKAAGMKAGIFSIDDKWEGRYGNLRHDEKRLPGFPQFLDRVRAEGYHVGLWAAFMRCEDPADLGLEVRHMLHRPDGKPHRSGGNSYYILDFTHPEVEKVLTDRARAFMRTYKPALVKFDFGYELPLVRNAAPFNKEFAGERVLQKGLQIVVSALRAENPDVVVMYYQLSPLFTEFFDLHSTDDLYLAPGDYDYEANRRIYFASPLTQLGVAVYGSSGYDWSSSPVIWFDSVVSGTIGSLNDFKDDEFGEHATDEVIAMYNGAAKAVRPANLFTVIPFPPARPEAATRGGHTKSWARLEGGKITLIAQRPASFDDGDMLDHRATDARVAGLVTTDVPIVIASKTSDAITSATRLAVVPFGKGTFTLKRTQGRSARVTTHLFGGGTEQSSAAVTGGKLTLNVSRKGRAGKPVEWVEVNFA